LASVLPGVIGQLIALVIYSVVVVLTWPALEALVSERETQSGTRQMVGAYNCTWAGAAAIGYFTGGGLYQAYGYRAVFWLPAVIFVIELLLVLWLDKFHAAVLKSTPIPPPEPHHLPEAAAYKQPVKPQAFLQMAWLANPCAYIAINTLFAVMPGISQKLG